MTKTDRNLFEYERIDDPFSIYARYKWTISYNGFTIKGEASSVESAYRNGKKALKRYKKMEKRLNG